MKLCLLGCRPKSLLEARRALRPSLLGHLYSQRQKMQVSLAASHCLMVDYWAGEQRTLQQKVESK